MSHHPTTKMTSRDRDRERERERELRHVMVIFLVAPRDAVTGLRSNVQGATKINIDGSLVRGWSPTGPSARFRRLVRRINTSRPSVHRYEGWWDDSCTGWRRVDVAAWLEIVSPVTNSRSFVTYSMWTINSSPTAHLLAPVENISRPTCSHYHSRARNNCLLTL